MGKKAVIIYLDPDTIEELDFIGKRLDKSRSELIRTAIIEFLLKPKYRRLLERRYEDVSENGD